jgi:hypothetical protein
MCSTNDLPFESKAAYWTKWTYSIVGNTVLFELSYRLKNPPEKKLKTIPLFYLPETGLADAPVDCSAMKQGTPLQNQILLVRGWATRSNDGRTHAGYILNPSKSMRAYAVPGQWITLYSNRPPFTFPKR